MLAEDSSALAEADPVDPASPDDAAACANCGHAPTGTFCPTCGQKTVPFQRPIHHLGREVVADYFGVDGKLWRTLVPLFLRPGFLTREYLDGRRSQYVRPVRLYLTASIVLFFLLSVLPEGGFLAGAVSVEDQGAVSDSLAAAPAMQADDLEANAESLVAIEQEVAELDSVRAALVAVRDSLREVVAEGAVAAAGREVADADGDFWDRFGEMMGQKGRRIGEMGEEGAEQWFIDSFTSNMPKAMFVLLPLFALLLKGLYVRRKRYYGEHLVFALHTHAFAFFVFAALALVLAFVGNADQHAGWARTAIGLVTLGLLAAVPAHVLLALKRVYGQGWVRTVLKWGLLLPAYTFVLGLGMAAVVLIAFLLL